ncbi:hypothetical protein TWF730_009072 [Orbilia blumenaviensis]|uniref:Uncharacterized protein n=1 Tax=Orbilia blumenaviensis TaxID=1796055 RepID=A0AAV9UX99_9PEZI
MPKKTYLRPPNDDYAPDTNICLGHVWRDPKDPGSFIGPPLPIPWDIAINHTRKESCSIDLSHDSHVNVGFWAKVATLPITAGAFTSCGTAKSSIYNIPTMDTYSIEPTPEYVSASVGPASAEDIRRGCNFYMVTGVKIARGGSGLNTEYKTLGVGAAIGVDATAVGVPVEVGKEIGYLRGGDSSQSFGSTSDFVFAYRVREVFYSRKRVLKTKQYNKGAVMGAIETITPTDEEKVETQYVIEDAEIGDDDFDFEIDGGGYPFVDDNGEEVGFIIQ